MLWSLSILKEWPPRILGMGDVLTTASKGPRRAWILKFRHGLEIDFKSHDFNLGELYGATRASARKWVPLIQILG